MGEVARPAWIGGLTVPVEIVGLKDLRKALKEAADATPREVTAALKEGAVEVTGRARGYIHSRSGKLAANAKPYATQREAGVRFTLVYAPVQEFGTTWTRRNPRSGRGKVTKGEKRAVRAGGKAAGTNTVHYTTPTPRFANRAVDELGPELAEATFNRLCRILEAHGWFDHG